MKIRLKSDLQNLGWWLENIIVNASINDLELLFIYLNASVVFHQKIFGQLFDDMGMKKNHVEIREYFYSCKKNNIRSIS